MRVTIQNIETIQNLERQGKSLNEIAEHEAHDIPFDLCVDCYLDGDHEDDVAHPPYDDSNYNCFVCGKRLVWADGSEAYEDVPV